MKVVYIAEARGQYKIGHSKDPVARMPHARESHIHMRFRYGEYPIVIHTIPATVAHRVEKALHWLFRHKKVYGEWFALNEQDLLWIRSQSAESILRAADAEWYRVQAIPRGQRHRETNHGRWKPESAQP